MWRLRLSFLLILLGFLVVINRLFSIQVLNPNRILKQQAYVRTDKHPALRGEIYDKNGQPLVLNRKLYDVYADIDALKKNNLLQKELKKELTIKNSTLSAILKLNNWRKIKTSVSVESKEKLDKYYPVYLNFEEDWGRYYPESSSSAGILGFVGRDEVGQSKGYVGVEGYYDQELTGMPTLNQNETDLFGIPFIGGIFNEQTTLSGIDLYLSTDINIQRIVEKELYKGLIKYQAKKACALIMAPTTGKMLALSCVPSFVPEKYYQFKDKDFYNPAISGVFEPGSTFKPLIVAMGLDQKKIKENSVFPEKGPVEIDGYEIRTWDNKYRGNISVAETLAKSSNVGMVKIIQKLSRNSVSQYLDKLGLRDVTGIELEGEVSSLIKDESDWYDLDYATLSFGQGFAVTPIQMLRAFNTLANGGFLVRPTVLDYLFDRKAQKKILNNNVSKQRVFKDETISKIRKLLFNAINKSEATWPNKLEGYSYCGKTGTAQIAIAGKYDINKTNASFIGFVPCNKPKFTMLVWYQEPKSSIWGSETAAVSFFEIAKQLILYYNIAPND